MKKTLTINLSGIVFHIDEDAYEKLGSYLNTIKKSFSDSDGRDEIMADIEARIAEMLQEKVGQNKQVVSIGDIDHVINIMGKPEDFAGETEPGQEQQKAKEQTSGYYNGRQRRIFRDPDERMLGGVCTGVASYFGFDPLWMRLGFALSFFIFGTGLLLYIILWIVIPVAKTTADKLEMRGEPVNIDNIGKTINEETEHLKKKVNDLKNEFRSKENRQRMSSAAENITGFLTQIFGTIFKIIGNFVAVLMIIIGTLLVVALMASLFGVNSVRILENGQEASYSIREFGNILFNSVYQMDLAFLGIGLLLGVIFIRLIYGGFKILFKIPHTNRILRYTFTTLWITGLLISIYAGILFVRDFNVKAKTTHNVSLQEPGANILYLKVKTDPAIEADADDEYEEGINIHNKKMVIVNNHRCNLVTFDEKKITLGPPDLNIIPGETDSFELIITTNARGETKKDAMNRAKKIKYNIVQTDSVIEFDHTFEIASEDKWRGQNVELTLKVPKNKMIYLDKSMRHIIYDIKNASNTLDEDMLKRRWVMGINELKCVDCEGLDVDKDEMGIPPPPPPAVPGEITIPKSPK
ncbi:MAG: PspC domain-containing protein [Bacteroidia bacterium]|nr:PspC domain-containing protein [Bacteroidia bacterium]